MEASEGSSSETRFLGALTHRLREYFGYLIAMPAFFRSPTETLGMSDATEKAANDSVKQRIASALISSGYTTLDAQAGALGLGRSTTWHIIKSKHKIGRLSAKVRRQMLANPNLPPLVRRELDAHDSAEALTGERPLYFTQTQKRG